MKQYIGSLRKSEEEIMKKFKNSRRHMITAVCLAVGLLVLTTSVYANFDNANGYSNYKNAVKKLAFDTNDVTLDCKMEFLLDDEPIFGAEAGMKINEDGKSEYSSEWQSSGYEYSSYLYYHDGKEYRYYPEENEYAVWDYDWNSYGNTDNLMGVDTSDKTFNKAVRFVELGADLLIGDLKNNVVLVSNENGIREYQVNVAQNQMPEIVNAGLSLMFTAYSGEMLEERSFVTYDNYMKAYENYFMTHGGDENVFHLWHYGSDDEIEAAGYDDYDDFYDEYADLMEEMNLNFDSYYEDMFQDEYDGDGILYVKEDGSVKHYESYKEYMFREGNADSYWYYLFGEDPYVSNAKMTVKLNDKNELVENYVEGTLVGVDTDGQKHTATIKITLNAQDYGTTEYDVLDISDKQRIN